MLNETLRLFNAIQVDVKQSDITHTQDVLERTIKNGYVLDPSISTDYTLLNKIESIVGISGEKANASFHKSWSVVKNESMELLVLQQMLHYLTTYGFKARGIYREDAVYIPHEVLDLPDVKDDIPLTIIKAFNKEEILEAIVNLGSGIALAQETLDDIMVIVKTNKYDNSFIDKINNRELKALLYDHYGIVPSEPTEFLRHLISKLTDESLVIKNNELIKKIKGSNGKFLDELLKKAPDNLASIFFRFKPLFLAMKSISNNKAFFNQLRKKANKLHVPVPEDYLNNVTSQIKHEMLDLKHLVKKIKKATIFRKIRLAHALNYRLGSENSIVYRVRNGRGWATDFNWDSDLKEDTREALNIVLDSIAKDVKKNVKGKTFYIPANVHYALPATEKQFTGHLPTGSWVSVPEDLIVGIHWTNVKRQQIDLDLSLIGLSGKIGWDGDYRSEERDILFSGDITNAPAPRGASELFYVKNNFQEPKILIANYYNFSPDIPVDCKIIAAHEKVKRFGENYMVDVNNIIASANVKISKKQNILGLIINIDGENRVYFTNVSVGNSITSSMDDNSMHARNYLIGSTTNTIDLREILINAGAIVVDEKPDGEFNDLSPEMLNKETLINLIT